MIIPGRFLSQENISQVIQLLSEIYGPDAIVETFKECCIDNSDSRHPELEAPEVVTLACTLVKQGFYQSLELLLEMGYPVDYSAFGKEMTILHMVARYRTAPWDPQEQECVRRLV